MELKMTTLSIEQRLQRLEDHAEISQLMMRYADIINKGWGGRVAEAGRIGEVFATDARWYSKDMDIEARGVEQIARGLIHSTADIVFSQHVFLNPIIEVAGDSATASWLMWIAVRRSEGSRLVYLSEDVSYRRTGEGWRIQELVLEVAGFNPLETAVLPA
jgi:hypothetical protein